MLTEFQGYDPITMSYREEWKSYDMHVLVQEYLPIAFIQR